MGRSTRAVRLTRQFASQAADLVLEYVCLHLGGGEALFQLGQSTAGAVGRWSALRAVAPRVVDAGLGHLQVGPPPCDHRVHQQHVIRGGEHQVFGGQAAAEQLLVMGFRPPGLLGPGFADLEKRRFSSSRAPSTSDSSFA